MEVQSGNKIRINVWLNDEFAFGLYQSVFVEYSLKKGMEIDLNFLEKLLDSEQRFDLREYLIRLLSVRSHTSFELRTKATRKGYSSPLIEDIIEEFRENGLIDEHDFALKYARELSNNKKWGPAKIRAALMTKGIPSKYIDSACEEIHDPETDNAEVLEFLVQKASRRLKREQDPSKRKKKLFDHLQRKGHSPSLILKHIDDLLKIVEDA